MSHRRGPERQGQQWQRHPQAQGTCCKGSLNPHGSLGSACHGCRSQRGTRGSWLELPPTPRSCGAAGRQRPAWVAVPAGPPFVRPKSPRPPLCQFPPLWIYLRPEHHSPGQPHKVHLPCASLALEMPSGNKIKGTGTTGDSVQRPLRVRGEAQRSGGELRPPKRLTGPRPPTTPPVTLAALPDYGTCFPGGFWKRLPPLFKIKASKSLFPETFS